CRSTGRRRGLHAGLRLHRLAQPARGERRRRRAMTSLELGIWSFPILLALIFLRIPIGLAMLMVGFFGTWLVTGTWTPILAQMKSLTYDTFSNYSLSIVPLFLLMGQFATRGGMSQAL